MELSDKIRHILSADRWYHATTRSSFENIVSKGVIADYNKSTELDFGYGFYLTTSEKLAESYISKLYSWRGNADSDCPVIMEYGFSPLGWFIGDKYNTAIYPEFDDSFAEFVFENRMNCTSGRQMHNYDVIYGVMSDSVPTKLLLQFRAGEISREDVIRGLKKGNSMKQISLHSQDLCDIIRLERAYQYSPDTKERKELDIHERKSIAVCQG